VGKRPDSDSSKFAEDQNTRKTVLRLRFLRWLDTKSVLGRLMSESRGLLLRLVLCPSLNTPDFAEGTLCRALYWFPRRLRFTGWNRNVLNIRHEDGHRPGSALASARHFVVVGISKPYKSVQNPLSSRSFSHPSYRYRSNTRIWKLVQSLIGLWSIGSSILSSCHFRGVPRR
jgi:hypothetical protein